MYAKSSIKNAKLALDDIYSVVARLYDKAKHGQLTELGIDDDLTLGAFKRLVDQLVAFSVWKSICEEEIQDRKREHERPVLPYE